MDPESQSYIEFIPEEENRKDGRGSTHNLARIVTFTFLSYFDNNICGKQLGCFRLGFATRR